MVGHVAESGGKSIHWPHIQCQIVFSGSGQHNYYCQQRQAGKAHEWSISLDINGPTSSTSSSQSTSSTSNRFQMSSTSFADIVVRRHRVAATQLQSCRLQIQSATGQGLKSRSSSPRGWKNFEKQNAKSSEKLTCDGSCQRVG